MRRLSIVILLATGLGLGCAACTQDNAEAAAGASKKVDVVFETTLGKISLHLYDDKAPISAQNFRQYVDAGFYDGIVFHRVIPGFMIQGGGFTADLQRKQINPPIQNESTNGLQNKRGTLSMARTNAPHSATSQFFLNVVDNNRLDHQGGPNGWGYAVFAEVVEGMDVADKIVSVETLCPTKPPAPCTEPLPQGMRDVPKVPVVITKAYTVK
jgi:cyclophilin family peptidyl-prolyl cis-trans isomerase